MKSIFEIDKNLCTGCRACESICPQKCIKMITDDEGFLVPHIINSLDCIKCNMCVEKCPANSDYFYAYTQKAYGMINKNVDVLKKSTSGGVFSELAREFIARGQYVFGSVYEDHFYVKTIGINNINELDRMCGSKYVMSDPENIYSEIKKTLDMGYKVLFCSVPCQISAIKAYLHKEYENLYLVDLLCHGCPSNKLFQEYLTYIEKKYKKTIKEYIFRDKAFGWKTIGTIVFDDGSRISKYGHMDPYRAAFYSCKIYRKSCYKCKYANSKRVGDLTIGDYWGVENKYPERNSKMGVSCVISNSDKGEFLVKMIKDHMECFDTTVENISLYNSTLREPANENIYRDIIYKSLLLKEFSYISNNYMYNEKKWKMNIKQVLKRVIPSKNINKLNH